MHELLWILLSSQFSIIITAIDTIDYVISIISVQCTCVCSQALEHTSDWEGDARHLCWVKKQGLPVHHVAYGIYTIILSMHMYKNNRCYPLRSQCHRYRQENQVVDLSASSAVSLQASPATLLSPLLHCFSSIFAFPELSFFYFPLNISWSHITGAEAIYNHWYLMIINKTIRGER